MRTLNQPPKLADPEARSYLIKLTRELNELLSEYERNLKTELSEIRSKADAASEFPASVKAQVEGALQRLDSHIQESNRRYLTIEARLTVAETNIDTIKMDIEGIHSSIMDIWHAIGSLS